MHRNMHIKKTVLTFTLVTLIFIGVLLILQSCMERATYYGDYRITPGQKEFFGFTLIEIDKKTHNLNDPIPITFYYGHKYEDLSGEETIINHHVSVYLATTFKSPFYEPELYVELYRLTFEGSSFTQAENAILNTSLRLNQKIKYQKSFDLDVSMDLFDRQEGMLVLEIAKEVLTDNGNGLETITLFERAHVFFKIENNKVTFNWRQFST